MICPRCSRQLPDGSKFCDGCGMSLNAAPAQAPVQPPVPPVQTPPNYNQGYQQQQSNYGAPAYVNVDINQGYQAPRVSAFNGSVFETFVAGLVASLIITCTCGIATPWAMTYMLKFIFEHTTIDGKRLTFDGNGAELFGQWIIWFILTGITCGIYSFWVVPKMYNWVAKHTHFIN